MRTRRWRFFGDDEDRSGTGGSPEPPAGDGRTDEDAFALEDAGLHLPSEGDGGSQPPGLFSNRQFVALWGAQGISQTINTGLQFVLLILIVDRFESSIAGSGLIVAMAAPRIGFSAPTGSVEDRLSGRSLVGRVGLSSGMAELVELSMTGGWERPGDCRVPRAKATATRQVVTTMINSGTVRGDAMMETPCRKQDSCDYCPSCFRLRPS